MSLQDVEANKALANYITENFFECRARELLGSRPPALAARSGQQDEYHSYEHLADATAQSLDFHGIDGRYKTYDDNGTPIWQNVALRTHRQRDDFCWDTFTLRWRKDGDTYRQQLRKLLANQKIGTVPHWTVEVYYKISDLRSDYYELVSIAAVWTEHLLAAISEAGDLDRLPGDCPDGTRGVFKQVTGPNSEMICVRWSHLQQRGATIRIYRPSGSSGPVIRIP